MKLEEVVRNNLIRIRREKGITQAEVGRRSERSRYTVSLYESGKRIPDVKALEKLSGALEVEPVEFFKGFEKRDGK